MPMISTGNEMLPTGILLVNRDHHGDGYVTIIVQGVRTNSNENLRK